MRPYPLLESSRARCFQLLTSKDYKLSGKLAAIDAEDFAGIGITDCP